MAKNTGNDQYRRKLPAGEDYGGIVRMDEYRQRDASLVRAKKNMYKRTPKKRGLSRETICFLLALTLLVVGFSFIKLSRHSIYTQNTKKIAAQKTQIDELDIEKNELIVKLAMAEDISYVEEVARADLAMQYPSQDQYRYVNVPGMPQIIDNETEAASITETRGIWNAISAWFNN